MLIFGQRKKKLLLYTMYNVFNGSTIDPSSSYFSTGGVFKVDYFCDNVV